VTPEEVARAYLDAVARRDGSTLRRLFASDAELITAAGTFRGPEEIAGFYEASAFIAGELEPRAGPMLFDAGRVAVEIELHIAGVRLPVADFFTIESGQITRLAVYTGPPPA
jgi:hypothetical protein